MSSNPEVARLREELEQLGAVVAPHRDHLCVRLPLFASVRVRVDDDGRLDCEPMFGPLSRTRAMLFSTTLLTLVAAGLFVFLGTTPVTLGVAFLALMSGVGNAIRFTVTENCITRVQLLWATRESRRGDARAPFALAEAMPELESPRPGR